MFLFSQIALTIVYWRWFGEEGARTVLVDLFAWHVHMSCGSEATDGNDECRMPD